MRVFSSYNDLSLDERKFQQRAPPDPEIRKAILKTKIYLFIYKFAL